MKLKLLIPFLFFLASEKRYWLALKRIQGVYNWITPKTKINWTAGGHFRFPYDYKAIPHYDQKLCVMINGKWKGYPDYIRILPFRCHWKATPLCLIVGKFVKKF